MIIIVVFFSLSLFFFQSDNISHIYHWTKMRIHSIDQSNDIWNGEEENGGCPFDEHEHLSSRFFFPLSRMNAFIWLVVRLQQKKSREGERKPEHIDRHTKHKLPCTSKQREEREVGNRKKILMDAYLVERILLFHHLSICFSFCS